MPEAPDRRVSLTDPDARSMAPRGRVKDVTLPDTAMLTYDYDGMGRLKAVLNRFGERIDVAPVDGGFEIALTGDTARMVGASLAGPESKKAVLDERTACPIKVVAGPEFECVFQSVENLTFDQAAPTSDSRRHRVVFPPEPDIIRRDRKSHVLARN